MRIKLEEDFPEYDDGPDGGDILEVVSYNEEGAYYLCVFNGRRDFVVEEYCVEEVIYEGNR